MVHNKQADSTKARVAQRVRALRLAAGLSQFKLAARAGVSLQTVSLAERGGLLSETTAAKLAAVLGATAEELRR